MTDEANLNEAERASKRVVAPDGRSEDPLRRRDRKRWNTRTAAIAEGIAVFITVALILISVAALTSGETPAVPGPAETGPMETGPTETGPAETAPPSAPASAAPDMVRTGMCSDGARWRLEATDTGDWIKVRFEVHQSPVGHEWRIVFRYLEHNITPLVTHVFFRGTRVASGGGVFVVQVRHLDWERLRAGLVGKAVDGQTGQVCKVRTWYRV